MTTIPLLPPSMPILPRQRFLAGVALALALAWTPGESGARQDKLHRVAFIATTTPLAELTGPDPINPAVRALVHRLRDLGYVEGRNLKLEMRTLGGDLERTEGVAAELAQLRTDVLVLPTSALVPSVRKVAPRTPIVMLVGSNVMQSGLIQSLARPGGNLTGLSVDVDTEVEAKRLEMLLEVARGARRVAYAGMKAELDSIYGQRVQAAARRSGVELIHALSTTAGFGDAFKFIARERPDAFLVAHGPVSYAHRRQIGELAAASGIPGSCGHAEAVAHGCLMSYGASLVHILRRAGDYVHRILKGADAGGLPIEQPTVFELVVNRRTARAIGVEVPKSILLRADRVHE